MTLGGVTTDRIERMLAYRAFRREGCTGREVARQFGISYSAYQHDLSVINTLGEENLRRELKRRKSGRPAVSEPLPTTCQYHVVARGKAVPCGRPGYPYCEEHRVRTEPVSGHKCGAGRSAYVILSGQRRK